MPHKFCCAPRAPAVRNLGGTCPRQLCGGGAGAYAVPIKLLCACVLTVSRNIKDLRRRVGLTDDQEYNLNTAVNLVQEGRQDVLEEMGMPRSSWNDVLFMFSKLIASGFTA